jgi:hypothetical protein
MSQYKKIFTIQLKHLYYGTDQTKFINDFDLVPSPETEQILKNFGMVAKQTGDSIVVLGSSTLVDLEDPEDPEDDFYKLFKSVGEKTKFRFYLKLKTPTFHNFTDIPLSNSDGTVYYFNNRAAFIPDSGHLEDNLILLDDTHTGYYVDGSERMIVRSELFSISLPDEGTVQIIDVYNSENIVFDSGAVELEDEVQFDLRGKVTPGRYKVMQDGSPVGDEFYIDPLITRGGVFGVIEIFEVSTDNADYAYVSAESGEEGKILHPTYVLAFKNRSTKWKYIVHINDIDEFPPSTLRIDGTSPVAFSGAPSVPGDPKIAVFTSAAAIPLVHSTYKNIILHKWITTDDSDYDPGTDIGIVLNMPNPSIQVVKPAGSDVFSEIFVYV